VHMDKYQPMKQGEDGALILVHPSSYAALEFAALEPDHIRTHLRQDTHAEHDTLMEYG
jgi:hypothetical protein